MGRFTASVVVVSLLVVAIAIGDVAAPWGGAASAAARGAPDGSSAGHAAN